MICTGRLDALQRRVRARYGRVGSFFALACFSTSMLFAPPSHAQSLLPSQLARTQPAATLPSQTASLQHPADPSLGPLRVAARPSQGSSILPDMPQDMNEQIIEVPANASGSLKLQTTIFKPDGNGPFPMVIFNHGKERGDPHFQARSRPLSLAREFVRRGYVVVAPNRRGFAGSGGIYLDAGCNVEGNGNAQALDVTATVNYMATLPYVDPTRILITGASHGGLTSIAYAQEAAPGVRGVVNFAGGLRQDDCTGWQANLERAFAAYGRKDAVPTLWVYGDNDAYWSPDLVRQMLNAFIASGGNATMVDFGDYKDNAHRLVGDRDAVPIWWPIIDAFLKRVDLPTAVRYRVPETGLPDPTGFAQLNAVDAVPFLDGEGRLAYQTFLHLYPTRAFAISESGAWAWAEGGDDPLTTALASCQKNSTDPCQLYAVNSSVVWPRHH